MLRGRAAAAVAARAWTGDIPAPRQPPTEPQNWLTYSGNYQSQRYSLLDQITPANVKNLKLQWVYQSPVAGNWQTTPLVVDGIMYSRSGRTTSSRSMR